MTHPSALPDTDVLLRDPGELIATLPALLGFHPRESLVLLAVEPPGAEPGRRIRAGLRVDLPPPDGPPGFTGELAALAATQHCTDLGLVVIGSAPDPPTCGPPGPLPPAHRLVERLRRQCRRRGLWLRDAYWTPRIATGAPWRCYEGCACAGELPDPSATAAAAAAVLHGQVIHPDRAAVERLVAPGEPGELARRSRLLEDRIDRAEAGEVALAEGMDSLRLVLDWLARADAGPARLADADVVALCLALTDRPVRDVCCGLAFGERAGAAERLWTALLAAAPDPEAAEPAVLLACCALARRDGALVGVALERALTAWPGHRLAELFDAALRAGRRPDELRKWFLEGATEALELLTRWVAR
jgi:hypothetical protein